MVPQKLSRWIWIQFKDLSSTKIFKKWHFRFGVIILVRGYLALWHRFPRLVLLSKENFTSRESKMGLLYFSYDVKSKKWLMNRQHLDISQIDTICPIWWVFSPIQYEIYAQYHKWSQFLFSAVMCFMSFGLAVTSLESDWYYLTQFHDNDKPGAQFLFYVLWFINYEVIRWLTYKDWTPSDYSDSLHTF